MKRLTMITVGAAVLGLSGCTKLEEQLQAEITLQEFESNPDIPGLLRGIYNSFRGPFQDQTGVFCLQDMSTDQCIGVTRGGDWDDNGVWRVLHTHAWDPENERIRNNFNNLLQIVYNTTNIQKFPQTSNQVKAEALFLRSYAMFYVLDLYNQVPFRELGSSFAEAPITLEGTAALERIIADLNEALPNLPDGPAFRANKDAARALLMKCFLNKHVYATRMSGTVGAPAAADMQQVITLGNQIVSSGRYALGTNFFDQFRPDNGQTTKEFVFSLENTPDEAGNIRFHWHASTHYNQNPSGWNGFSTLASLYDSFEPTDQRRGVAYAGFTDRTGLRVGLLEGQQFNAAGDKLKDRAGNDLVFTRAVTPVASGNVELPGIRVNKFVPDMLPNFSADRDVAQNDYPMLRYADVLMMIGEAHFNTNQTNQALGFFNQVRSARGASALTALNADVILAERGRELYWESWRRNDMIRFNKFLAPYGPTKPQTSDRKYIVFPIPNSQLAVNPNLKQNPGY